MLLLLLLVGQKRSLSELFTGTRKGGSAKIILLSTTSIFRFDSKSTCRSVCRRDYGPRDDKAMVMDARNDDEENDINFGGTLSLQHL
jgi:hypothetical protein